MSGSGVRISSGALAGRRLLVPSGTRPTSGKVREALCDLWAGRLPGARVLDLFAGSGACALEALSRGAAEATLVESSGPACRILQAACRELAPDRASTQRLSLPDGASRLPAAAFDLVIADPPYEYERFEELLTAVARLLRAGGEFALEHSHRQRPPRRSGGLAAVDERRYGDSTLTFYALERDAGSGGAGLH